MRALQISEPGIARVTNVPGLEPAADEALVKVLACGMCGSDVYPWRGAPGVEYPMAPGAPGHEIWGEVVRTGRDVRNLPVGTRVTGLASGGYAEYVLAKGGELIPVAGETPVLGEPLACAANVLHRAQIQPGQPVVIVGFGYIAAIAVQLQFPTGGNWITISRRKESRDLALSLGAQAAYSFDTVPAHLWASFPVVIEAAGVQQALDYASWLVAIRGKLVIAGYHADGPRTVNMQTWNWKGIDVINAHERAPEAYLRGMREGLALAERHNLKLDRLISHRFGLEDAERAFALHDERPAGYVKGIITPW